MIITYLLTYSMVYSPSWEANWFAGSQGIPRISRNPKVHYRTHKRPPPVSILASPIQSICLHTNSWRSILILSTHLRLGLPSELLPRGFPTKTLYTPLSSTILATCPAHLILLDFITRTILCEEYKSFSSSLDHYILNTFRLYQIHVCQYCIEKILHFILRTTPNKSQLLCWHKEELFY